MSDENIDRLEYKKLTPEETDAATRRVMDWLNSDDDPELEAEPEPEQIKPPDEFMELLYRTADKLIVRRILRKMALKVTAGLAVCCGIAALCFALAGHPITGEKFLAAMYSPDLPGGAAIGGYLLAAVLAFVVGVIVTVAAMRHFEKTRPERIKTIFHNAGGTTK